jgi:murein DD-endopeptidase MepM/ murein hydrolase activator NlpD
MRSGLSVIEAHALAKGLRDAGANLRRMRAGDRLEISRDAGERIVAVAYAPSAWQRFHVNRERTDWTVERTDVTPEIRTEIREGEVRNSLWDAVDAGAIGAQTMLDLVQIFESSFDFTADTRAGDRFRLLVEARYANGTFVEDGRILAAQYVTEDGTLAGVAFEVGGRTAYCDPDGRSLKRMFLRSPLQFSRISSGFTHRRPHPVLGGVRPHLAIDYAAPAGTPVWAVADGTVEFAGRKGGNGIQVLLRHRAGYKTYYNHLSRIAKGVRPGARVAQKQVIGYVGSTGLSTGPHLDYRVSVRGAFVNPLAEKFLPGEPIPAAQRAAFAAHAGELLGRLERAAKPGTPPRGEAAKSVLADRASQRP